MSRHDARDVLPDGRPARPSLDALSRRRRHRAHAAALHRLPRPADEVRRVHEEGRAAARRPVRLLLRGAARLRGGRPAPRPARLLGLVQRPGRLRLHVPAHERVGQGDVRHARRHRRRQGGHARPGRHQPRHPHPARLVVLRRLGGRRDVRPARPARQPGRPAPSVEPDDDAAAAEARLRRQVHLGHVAALAATRGPASTWRSTPAAARSPGSGRRRWRAWSTSATSRRPATASRSTCRRRR